MIPALKKMLPMSMIGAIHTPPSVKKCIRRLVRLVDLKTQVQGSSFPRSLTFSGYLPKLEPDFLLCPTLHRNPVYGNGGNFTFKKKNYFGICPLDVIN